MQTMTLEISNNVFDKFKWLLNHFSSDEIKILSSNNEEYISEKKLQEYKSISSDYKKGDTEDFEEYEV